MNIVLQTLKKTFWKNIHKATSAPTVRVVARRMRAAGTGHQVWDQIKIMIEKQI